MARYLDKNCFASAKDSQGKEAASLDRKEAESKKKLDSINSSIQHEMLANDKEL